MMIRTDQEYFEKYFAIAELLVEKELITGKLWDEDRSGNLSDIHYQCRRNLAMVNTLILEEEETLRKMVAASENAGSSFVFERFARRYKLTPFERRLTLFFLHMDLFRDGHVALERRELAAVLDCEGTALSRSATLLDLFQGSVLYKKRLITEVFNTQVRLAVPMRDKLRKLISGRRGRIGREEKNPDETTDNAGIGQICKPEYKMEDVVLAPEKLSEVLMHVDTHKQMTEMGMMKGRIRGKGLGMLFFGPPGTGKSMLAHALAAHTGKNVLQASVSQIKDKFVGESEKNIVKLFKLAKEKGCVICLDEADSLISSREGATRNWEISQVNVLLEEVEKFDGIIIMTTNMETRLDPALERRLALRVRFDLPSAEVRQKIWRKHIPSSMKCAEDIDWARLGEKYTISGGYIKNAVLSAVRCMLSRKADTLAMEDLVFAAENESKSMFGGAKVPVGFAARI